MIVYHIVGVVDRFSSIQNIIKAANFLLYFSGLTKTRQLFGKATRHHVDSVDLHENFALKRNDIELNEIIVMCRKRLIK